MPRVSSDACMLRVSSDTGMARVSSDACMPRVSSDAGMAPRKRNESLSTYDVDISNTVASMHQHQSRATYETRVTPIEKSMLAIPSAALLASNRAPFTGDIVMRQDGKETKKFRTEKNVVAIVQNALPEFPDTGATKSVSRSEPKMAPRSEPKMAPRSETGAYAHKFSIYQGPDILCNGSAVFGVWSGDGFFYPGTIKNSKVDSRGVRRYAVKFDDGTECLTVKIVPHQSLPFGTCIEAKSQRAGPEYYCEGEVVGEASKKNGYRVRFNDGGVSTETWEEEVFFFLLY